MEVNASVKDQSAWQSFAGRVVAAQREALAGPGGARARQRRAERSVAAVLASLSSAEEAAVRDAFRRKVARHQTDLVAVGAALLAAPSALREPLGEVQDALAALVALVRRLADGREPLTVKGDRALLAAEEAVEAARRRTLAIAEREMLRTAPAAGRA